MRNVKFNKQRLFTTYTKFHANTTNGLVVVYGQASCRKPCSSHEAYVLLLLLRSS